MLDNNDKDFGSLKKDKGETVVDFDKITLGTDKRTTVKVHILIYIYSYIYEFCK
jgi:hypothetical protein